MKNVRICLSAIICVQCFMGCSTNPTTGEEEDNSPSVVKVLRSENVHREANPGVSGTDTDDLAAGNKQFAFDLYERIREDPTNRGENLFLSPYSISVALAQAFAGAEGETESQMHDALRFTLSEPDLHKAFNKLETDMESAADGQDNLTLSVVNALWGQKYYEFRQNFLDDLARNYGAGMNLLDFAADPDGSRIVINDWVEKQTNDKIEDLLPPGSIKSYTTLVITNAIYFLADWLQKFDSSLTREKDFHLTDGSVVSVPLMSLCEEDKKAGVLHAATEKSNAVELDYVGNRFAMLAVLPRDGQFESFEENFSVSEYDAVVNALDSTQIQVKIPRFTFSSPSMSLKQALRDLGMESPFNGGADFSGISGAGDLYIGDVIHKAFVSVDEKGTEAAAATAVIIDRKSAGTDTKFIADRPFLFFIRDRVTGAVLFMGRVLNPNEED